MSKGEITASRDDDGDITIDIVTGSERKAMSVSVTKSGHISWGMLFGDNRSVGYVPSVDFGLSLYKILDEFVEKTGE